MNNWREFRFVRNGKADLVWRICQSEDGKSYSTQHGQLDGKMQEYSDTPGPKGKEGTKAYVDEVANCVFNINREIRKKQEAGYLELIDGELVGEQTNEICFDKHLPKNFCSFKPQAKITDSALEKLHKTGFARYTRKYNGFCHLAVHHNDGWQIYSRRMDLLSGHFPNHIQELEKSSLGQGTILIGEMLCIDNGKDNFKATSRICRSLEAGARQLVTSGEVSEPRFIIFDCLFLEGRNLKDVCYDERSKIWKESFISHSDSIEQSLCFGQTEKLICHVDYFDVTPQTWNKVATDNGWEGFVVTDGQSVPGNKFFSFNGKAERPKGHYKLKPVYTEDCVMIGGLRGTGKRLEGIGSIYLKQIHPETGQWFDCGGVGSGFTDETVKEAWDLLKQYNLPFFEKDKDAKELDLTLNGPVCEIEYRGRQPGTNKFQHPVIKRFRFDKGTEECIAQQLAEEE